MKVVIQRVSEARVSVQEKVIATIGQGLLVLVGFENEESDEDLDWMAKKLTQLRIFEDEQGVMNWSVEEVNGEILLVSQFTLMASTKKGNRPSYIQAAKPEIAIPYYEKFITIVQNKISKPLQTGEFGADMKVSLLNDGPVTIVMDSKNRI